MAIIKHIASGNLVYLNARHVFGRNGQSSNTHIPEKDVSQSHATIYWQGDNWYMQDHSRNGTILKGQHMHRSTQQLSEGDLVQFGKSESTRWEFVNDQSPTSYLQLLKTNRILELRDVHFLPSEENPEVSILLGGNQSWVYEREGETFSLTNGEIISIGVEEWLFVDNEPLDVTVDYGQSVSKAFFLMDLSLDEEQIGIKIMQNDREMDLGFRSHNYLLLALSRARLTDKEQGIEPDHQGWMSVEALIEDVSKEMLKEVDEHYLNLLIFRLRKQLRELKPDGNLFVNVIERRKGVIRFSHPYFKIQKGSELLGEMMP
ncbi:MAG TPA: hypothetical protein DCE41_29730 [Cytophagales bacterium]|nr:hypothetical protein [Cytophagales bacterium]HAA23862.1 hypothetical protein [Cytophagales bacterium]HAP59925.1 hypothetical protein [Cytophagales bacterium]